MWTCSLYPGMGLVPDGPGTLSLGAAERTGFRNFGQGGAGGAYAESFRVSKYWHSNLVSSFGMQNVMHIDYIEGRWNVAHLYNGGVSLSCDRDTGIVHLQLLMILAPG